MDREKYLSIAETAELIGMTPAAVYLAIKNGRLPAERLPGTLWVAREDAERFEKGKKTITEKQQEANANNLVEGRRKPWTAERKAARSKAMKEYWDSVRQGRQSPPSEEKPKP